MVAFDGTVSRMALDPTWYQAGWIFLKKGVEHILIGADHLLFLLCLILPLYRAPSRLVGVVTAFTLGHSVTLIPVALGMAPQASWFIPLIETLIAASIVYMAIENVLGTRRGWRWRLAFGFGLIHGVGFASTLTDVIPLSGGHLLTSLVFFNIGIELGQILALALALPILALIFRTAAVERSGIVIMSVLAGHEAWHWTVERMRGVQLDIPPGDVIFSVLTWLGIALLPLTLVWWFRAKRRNTRDARVRPAE